MTTTPKQRSESHNKSIKLVEIARLVGGELTGDAEILITGIAGIKEAQEGELTFLANAKYLPFLSQSHASAVLVPHDFSEKTPKAVIRTKDPSKAFTQVIAHFNECRTPRETGIHPTAVIGRSAKLGSEFSVGAHAVIEADVALGDRTTIGAGVFIGRASVIGSDVIIYPNVTLRENTHIGDRVIIHSGTVIGADGFGYETVDGKHVKIPQTGCVRIDEDVEIGANVCIDRGRFGKTWIQKGTKIDNLVQIAHNVVIGENSLIVSQAGISGSSTLGKNVIIAGQAGIVGHVTLGDNVIVGAQTGISKSVPENTVMLGSPAKPIGEQKRLFALIARLPELFKEFSELKKKFSDKK